MDDRRLNTLRLKNGSLMKRSLHFAGIFLALSLMMVLACNPKQQVDTPANAPGIEDAANAEISGIYEQSVRLSDGRYEGKRSGEGSASRPTIRLVRDISTAGDLDGDDSDETAVLLIEDSGGSGSFLYLAILARRGGAIENRSTELVGDRVQVRSLKIAGRELIMDVVQHAPGDAMCCPMQKARRKWTLDGDDLLEGPSEISGKLSLADLAVGEWALSGFGRNEPYSGDPPVSLVFEDGRISGFSGCNRYFGQISEPGSGSIDIVELGMTRMTCPEEVNDIENRYLAALEGATGYRFIFGRLALDCKTENGSTTLVFVAVANAVSGD
jgi:heat shock protein HslJ